MAQTKTKSRPKKKAATRFYVVRRIQDARKKVADRIETYHQDYIKEPIENGKDVVKDFRDDPRKTLDTLVDDSRKFAGDVKKDAKKKVDGAVADGKKFIKKAKKNPRKVFNSVVDDGRDFAEDLLDDGKEILKGVEKDARLVVDEMVDSGKKAMDKLPGKKKFQKKIETRIKSVPTRFNLPTRRDIDRLMNRLENLDTKIDTLSKAYATQA